MTRTALITGASAGIGRELARLFAADGYDLVVVARREARLQELAEELEGEFDVTVHVRPADLADRSARSALFEGLSTDDLTIDFLVNNAGFGSNGRFWELDGERELNQIEVNVSALVHLTHLCLPGMVERGFGRVLNIASTAGFQPGPYMSTYYATKAFVISFSEGIAYELDGKGVTVTAHCPGATESEFAERAGNDKSALFQRGGIPTAEEVARHAYDAMHSGKTVAVHGAMNSVGAFMTRLSPRSTLRAMAAKFNKT